MEVIRDEWSDDIFFTIRNDKEVAGAGVGEVILPSGTR